MAQRAAAQTDYSTFLDRTAVWHCFEHRPGDIVIATYPKCGTTWTQRIVGLLVFGTPDPIALPTVSPWLDSTAGPGLAGYAEALAAQTHRRFLKTHLPYDGLPVREDVFYINVVRDPRDVIVSWWNHMRAMLPEVYEAFSEAGLANPQIGRPYPRPLDSPAAEFARWLREETLPGHEDGFPLMSYFHHAQVWWEARGEPNVLLVHYQDLKDDLAGEMARIAGFLGIEIDPAVMPALVESATFGAMKRDAQRLLPTVRLEGGGERFLNRGESGRWRGLLADEDLALCEEKLARRLPPDCAAYVTGGWRAFKV